MHFGTFFYGTVDMPDAGVDGPPAHTRNYGQEDYRRAYADLLAYAEACDTPRVRLRCGRAEHHFHNHGFEVVPNVVLLNAVLAAAHAAHPAGRADPRADRLAPDPLRRGLRPGRRAVGRAAALWSRARHRGARVERVRRQRRLRRTTPTTCTTATSSRSRSRSSRPRRRTSASPHRGRHYTIPPGGLTFRGEPVTRVSRWSRGRSTRRCASTSRSAARTTLAYAARQRHVARLANHPWERMVPWWRRVRRAGRRGCTASGCARARTACSRCSSTSPTRRGGDPHRAARRTTS